MSDHISIPTGDQLRDAMRFWTSGVTIVGAEYNGTRHAMTVSSFTSLALEPSLVIVSLQKTSRTHNLVIGSQAFSVTVLMASQQEISSRFAGLQNEQEDRFSGLDTFKLETGSPFLSDGLAFFDCRLVDQYDAGSNTVMIGAVVAARVNQDADNISPLVYYNRGYRLLADLRPPA